MIFLSLWHQTDLTQQLVVVSVGGVCLWSNSDWSVEQRRPNEEHKDLNFMFWIYVPTPICSCELCMWIIPDTTLLFDQAGGDKMVYEL